MLLDKYQNDLMMVENQDWIMMKTEWELNFRIAMFIATIAYSLHHSVNQLLENMQCCDNLLSNCRHFPAPCLKMLYDLLAIFGRSIE